MRTRTPVLISTALLSITLVTACGTNGDSDLTGPGGGSNVSAVQAADIESCDPTETTLEIFYPPQGSPAVDAAKTAMQERYPDLKIEGSPAPTSSYDELTQQVVADIAGGRDIDIVNAGNSQLRFYVDTYQPIPIDPTRLRDTYKTQYLNVGTVDEDLYMVPFQVSVPSLYYNKTLMAEAGLDPDDPPQTYTELIEASRALAEVTEADPVYVSPYDWIAQAAIQSAGGQYVAEDGTAGFDTEEGRQGLSVWSQLESEGLTRAVSSADEISSFATGKTALYVQSSALTAQLSEQVGDAFDWAIVPMPIADGGTASFPAGGNGWLSLADDPCEAAFANDFIAELLAPEALAESLRGFSYVPVDTEAQQLLLDDPTTSEQMAMSYEYDIPVTQWGGWPGQMTVEANTRVTQMAVSLAQGNPLEKAVSGTVADIDKAVK